MRDRSNEFRRLNRGRYSSRVRRGYLDHLSDVLSGTDGALHEHFRDGEKISTRNALARRNWRIQRYSSGEVVAVEPGREFETPFDGPEAFWDAVEYAAAKLKGGGADV